MSQELMPFIPAAGGLPEHLKNSLGKGNENVTTDDMSVPRLNILQTLSPQCDEDKAEYVEGAKSGLFHNSVTNELFESVYVLNLFYKKTFAVFNKRTVGTKAFHGTFESREDAEATLQEKGINLDTVDIVATGNHYCLLLDEEGKPKSPILLSLSSTKLRISDNWNSQLRMLDTDRFGSVWQLSTSKETNTKGSWYNLSINNVGYAPKDLYAAGEEAYNAIMKTVQVDQAA